MLTANNTLTMKRTATALIFSFLLSCNSKPKDDLVKAKKNLIAQANQMGNLLLKRVRRVCRVHVSEGR